MKAYKESKFLIFEFEDVDENAGKKAKFDLSTGDFISPSGRKVKTLDKYLNKYSVDTLIDSFEDEKYRKYLRFIKDMVQYNDNIICNRLTINNILLGAKKYMEFEKFYVYGVEVDYLSCKKYEYIPWTQEEIDEYEKKNNRKLYYTPNHSIEKFVKFEDIPKAILQFYKEHKIKIKYNICEEQYKDIIVHAIDKVKSINAGKEDYKLIFYCAFIEACYNIKPSFPEENNLRNYISGVSFYRTSTLLEDYYCDLNKLIEYVEYLMEVEHLACMDDDWKRGKNGPIEILDQLFDYNIMQRRLCGNEKYDKYPKNFLTVKNIVTYKYNSMIRQEKAKRLSENIYRPELEFETSGFVFISPKTPQDIVEEGKNMHNCVGGYVNSVLNDYSIIIFMRKSNSPDKSFITLELNSTLSVIQSKRKYNKSLNIQERQVLNQYRQFLIDVREKKRQEDKKDIIKDIVDLELKMERE